MGTLFVDKLDPQSGTSLELGSSGDTMTVPSGATLSIAGTINASSGTATGFGGANTPFFLAERTSPEQQISDNTVTKIEFQTETLDSGTVYDPSTNYRFTPGVAGKYYVFAGAGLSGDANNQFLDGSLYIYKNGSEEVSAHVNAAENYPRTLNFQIAHIFDLDADDYIEIYGYVNRQSAGNARVQASNNSYFGAFKLI
jgi:hypothetical protein